MRSSSGAIGAIFGEIVGTLPPFISLCSPVLVPPTVGLEHPQGQNVVDTVGMPPGAGYFCSHLNDVAVSTLDFTARCAPPLVAVIGIGNGVVVSLEVRCQAEARRTNDGIWRDRSCESGRKAHPCAAAATRSRQPGAVGSVRLRHGHHRGMFEHRLGELWRGRAARTKRMPERLRGRRAVRYRSLPRVCRKRCCAT